MPSISSPANQDQSVSVSVRKIENGYVVCRSEDGPQGYSYRESFSASRPTLEVEGREPKATGPSSLAKAIKTAKR